LALRRELNHDTPTPSQVLDYVFALTREWNDHGEPLLSLEDYIQIEPALRADPKLRLLPYLPAEEHAPPALPSLDFLLQPTASTAVSSGASPSFATHAPPGLRLGTLGALRGGAQAGAPTGAGDLNGLAPLLPTAPIGGLHHFGARLPTIMSGGFLNDLQHEDGHATEGQGLVEGDVSAQDLIPGVLGFLGSLADSDSEI
jgi:hypothetical protein